MLATDALYSIAAVSFLAAMLIRSRRFLIARWAMLEAACICGLIAALLLACGLPNLGKPILDRDLTNDRFGLWVPEIGPEWNEQRVINVLRGTHAQDIRVVRV